VANIDTFHVTFDEAGVAWAIVADELFVSRDNGATWAVHWTAPASIGVLSSRAVLPLSEAA
jgi:hypothetical protein